MVRIAMSYHQYRAQTGLNGKPNKRGSTIALVDHEFEFYDTMFGKTDLNGQIAVTLRLYEACKTWLQAKQGKDSQKGIGIFKVDNKNLLRRRMAIADVARQCIAQLQAANPAKAQFDVRKVDTLAAGKGAKPATGLTDEFKFERQTWLGSGKTIAIAGNFMPSAQAITGAGLDQSTFNDMSNATFLALHQLAQRQVLYYRKDERLQKMVRFNNGDAFLGNSVIPLDMALPPFNVPPYNHQAFDAFYDALHMYAMDEYGNIMCQAEIEYGHVQAVAAAMHRVDVPNVRNFNHSTFNAGKNVICAGLIGFTNGRITWIDSNSGHYKPTRENLKNAVMFLSDEGIDLSQLRIGAYKYGPNGPPIGIDIFSYGAFIANPNAAGNLAST